MPQPAGRPIANFHGLKIYAKLNRAKYKGKDRVWIQVRQDKPKNWRIAASLNYVNAMDVRFEK